MNKNARTNRLISESSPYLLQHAYNPVDWYPWGEEALQKAKTEDKPILVSIGYAACHWCHVMENQSFEHEQIAKLMNEHFVSIKVDREERPDVDQIYMDALQAMGLQGGWPLNVFLMPDARPFYGGTYFPPENWHQLLKNIATAYRDRRAELANSAEQFATVLNASDLEKYGITKPRPEVSPEDLDKMFQKFSTRFDKHKGGMKKAPKFPMPVNYFFLLRYYMLSKNKHALEHVVKTLEEMAYGGIYDQVGGGFARYSVDEDWLVPHFEKMLYDNGQLVSLYSEAWQVNQEKLFKETVYETIAFVSRELMSDEGGFYSSLDADSEGVEGKFYVFTHDELVRILGEEEEPLFSKYYQATVAGNWEHGVNILHRKKSDEKFAAENNLELAVLADLVQGWKEKLMAVRKKRIRPGLDDKILTSWNALMLKGLADAYRAFKEQSFLDMALRNAGFLMQKLRKPDGCYYHTYKNGKATVTGFLEDYAHLISAFIRLYEVTFDEKWLNEARHLTEYTLQNFFDKTENLFYFTDEQGEKLIARKKEVFDNVIPASNSVMAHNLHFLGLLLDKENWGQLSETMLNQVKELAVKEPAFLANWATLYLYKIQPTAEIAIVGPNVHRMRQELEQYYMPNTVITGTETSSDLPLLEDRIAIEGNTTIYVCFNKTCQLPVHTVTEALSQLQKIRSEMEEL